MKEHHITPGVYQHYKGDLYIVVGVARHHETGIEYVIYFPVKPHGLDKVVRLNVRPLLGLTTDPDGWGHRVRDENGHLIERFKLLHQLPLGAIVKYEELQ